MHKLAEAVAEGAEKSGAEVRLRRVPELAPYNIMYHWGSIIVPPGYLDATVYAAGGNPYGTAHPSSQGEPTEETLAAARFQGQRLATVTAALLSGRRD